MAALGRSQKFKMRHYQTALLAFRPVVAGDAARRATGEKRGVLPQALPASAALD
jgi:hypothetical protein